LYEELAAVATALVQSFAPVRLREIEQRADGNDARRVNFTVRDGSNDV